MEPAIAPIVAAVLCTKPQRLLTAHQMSGPPQIARRPYAAA
jgi:hypothetical protein